MDDEDFCRILLTVVITIFLLSLVFGIFKSTSIHSSCLGASKGDMKSFKECLEISKE